MRDSQMKQEDDQRICKRKLEIAQENLANIEQKLAAVPKPSKEYDDVFEEYLTAQEVLENESKNFEDLEFHHLEEKADWLASREELHREIMDLSQKIENIRVQISELEQQKQDASRTNTTEFKTMERQRMEQLVKLEEARNELKSIDLELHTFTNQDSEPEVSTDSDSDKGKETSSVSTIPPNMSCSMIEPLRAVKDEVCNMSQSFNEKMFLEKSVLEGGIGEGDCFVVIFVRFEIIMFLVVDKVVVYFLFTQFIFGFYSFVFFFQHYYLKAYFHWNLILNMQIIHCGINVTSFKSLFLTFYERNQLKKK